MSQAGRFHTLTKLTLPPESTTLIYDLRLGRDYLFIQNISEEYNLEIVFEPLDADGILLKSGGNAYEPNTAPTNSIYIINKNTIAVDTVVVEG